MQIIALDCVLIPFSVSVIKILTKRKLKIKIYLVTGSSSREARESSSRNLEAGTEAETVEGHCLLCCSPVSLSLLSVSYASQENPSRGGTATVACTLPCQSLIKEMLTDVHTGQSDGNNSLI